MAIDTIIKTVYRPGVLRALQKQLVLGTRPIMQGALSDTAASSMVAGGEVHIDTMGDVSSGDYDATTDFKTDIEDLATSKTILKLDQQKWAGYNLEKIDKIQAGMSLLDDTAQEKIASQLAEKIETYIASLYTDMTAGPGTEASPISVSTASDFYGLVLVPLAKKLSDNNVPRQGRFCVINPSLTAKLQLDSRFVGAGTAGSDSRLATGVVAQAAGFDLYECNSLAETSTDVGIKVLAGHSTGWAMAHNIEPGMVRVMDREGRMGQQVVAINVFGASVLDSSRLCRAIVSA